jgi:hypothetical protein
MVQSSQNYFEHFFSHHPHIFIFIFLSVPKSPIKTIKEKMLYKRKNEWEFLRATM